MSKYDIVNFSKEILEAMVDMEVVNDTEKSAEERIKSLWNAYSILIQHKIIKWDDSEWIGCFEKIGMRVINTNGIIRAIADTPASKVLYKENKN